MPVDSPRWWVSKWMDEYFRLDAIALLRIIARMP